MDHATCDSSLLNASLSVRMSVILSMGSGTYKHNAKASPELHLVRTTPKRGHKAQSETVPPFNTYPKSHSHIIKVMSAQILFLSTTTKHWLTSATLSKKSSRVQTALTNTSGRLVAAFNEEIEKIYKKIEILQKRKAEILHEMALISGEVCKKVERRPRA